MLCCFPYLLNDAAKDESLSQQSMTSFIKYLSCRIRKDFSPAVKILCIPMFLQVLSFWQQVQSHSSLQGGRKWSLRILPRLLMET